MNKTRTAFGKEIAKLLIDLDMDMAEFEKEASLPEKFLSDCTWGKRNPTLDACEDILIAAKMYGVETTNEMVERLVDAAAASQVSTLKLPLAKVKEDAKELFFFFANAWDYLPDEDRLEIFAELKTSALNMVTARLADIKAGVAKAGEVAKTE